jgi:hypothetical protein
MKKHDRTVERNYLQQWRLLISEYEAVKTGRSTAFRTVREFYKHHGTCSQTFRKYYNRYLASRSTADLLPKRRGPKCRTRIQEENDQAREGVFKMLHSPPSDFGFNRATWKRDDLQQALKTTGVLLSKRDIRSIIKAAGYRWLKAKKVLTSKDPAYRAKLDSVKSILDGLRSDEGFFSIDEFWAIRSNAMRWTKANGPWGKRHYPPVAKIEGSSDRHCCPRALYKSSNSLLLRKEKHGGNNQTAGSASSAESSLIAIISIMGCGFPAHVEEAHKAHRIQ